MKKLFACAILFLMLGVCSAAMGQSSGGPSVQCACDLTTGDQSTGCYSTKNGLGNNPWSMSLVVQILKPAKDHFGMSLGQLVQEYHDCGCVVTYLGGNAFRVQVGGGTGFLVDVGDL